MARATRDAIGLAALWAIVTAANLLKPFHIDDGAHLAIARWITSHPLHPMEGVLNWSGTNETIFHTNQPHLWFFLIAAWASLFGWSEPALHTLEAIASLGCVVLVHRLARRFDGRTALWVAAVVALGPAFVVEQNLMVDVPLLATWLGVFVHLTADRPDTEQHRRYALAASWCAAALLIKYSSVVLVLVLAVSLALERRPRQAWTLLIPVAALVAWSLFNLADIGRIHILARPHESHGRRWLLFEALAWLLALGGVCPLGAVAARRLFGVRPAIAAAAVLLALASVAAAAAVVATVPGPHHLIDAAFLLGFYADGALIACACLPDALDALRPSRVRGPCRGRPAAVFCLVLWIAITTAFYVRLAPFVAVRHVLLILPPIAILLAPATAGPDAWSLRAATLALAVAVSAGLGVSDFRFAAFYRTEARTLAGTLPRGVTWWTSGHWGWQWYAAAVGFRQLDMRRSRPHPGDVLAIALDLSHEAPDPPWSVRRLAMVRQPDPLLQLFCTGRDARFYASDALRPPWSLSRACGNRIEIDVVR